MITTPLGHGYLRRWAIGKRAYRKPDNAWAMTLCGIGYVVRRFETVPVHLLLFGVFM